MKIVIEEWDGDGAFRIPDEALQELELDVGDVVYLIEELVGNTRCLVLSKTPQIADRIALSSKLSHLRDAHAPPVGTAMLLQPLHLAKRSAADFFQGH